LDLELKGKITLITGGSKGIGLACAHKFRAEGAQVVICSRDQANIDAALALLPGVAGYSVDLTEAAAAGAMVAWVEREIGPVDILVNSAGAAKRAPVDELSPAAYRAAMDAKYFSYIHVIDPLIKRMAARGAGVIVNVIGNGGKIPSTTHIAGGAANAALMLATAGLGHAYSSRGVRVVGINPTGVETGRIAEGLAAAAKAAGVSVEVARADALASIPIGRMALPEEVADFVLYLASPRASYLSGVNYTLDGAQSPVVV
jgi:NAD(P)-dependent dehydrogenase (short-subunit alcohol dehydrogenase family)